MAQIIKRLAMQQADDNQAHSSTALQEVVDELAGSTPGDVRGFSELNPKEPTS
jgi:hypothetical protein